MWRDQLDAFWDGRRAFAIGFFEDEEAMGAPRPRPDLTVVSAKDATFTSAATLVDVIDARRWRCGHCLLELPLDHAYVSLRSPDGAELRVALIGEKTSVVGGELRLLLVEAPENPALPATPFRLASLSARGDWERLARDQIARSGSRLAWAVSQRRHVERRDGAVALVQLWPAQRAFPAHQSRIVVEPIEAPIGRGSSTLKAPFAIMENWLRENGAPCPTLRIRIPNTLDQNALMLGRTAIVLVLHQRRRFRDWVREQRDAGEPIVDPLVFEDIRQATGYALEDPEAVEAGGAMIAHNLASVIANHQTTDFDGLSMRRLSDGGEAELGVVVDIHFFGAALGDDVGLVSTAADAGDFGVVPVDPGGASYVRLFRVESDGLAPRRIDDDDLLLDDLLRLAADEEREAKGGLPRAGGGERAVSVQGRREKFLAALNASLATAGYAGRFDAARLWDIFDPVLMSSFVALVAEAAPEARAVLARLGGYDAYRADPSLVQAAMRLHEFAEDMDEAGFRDYRGGSKPLLHRFVGACHVSGLVAANADLAAQLRIWRLLAQPSLALRLTRARIALGGAEDIRQIAQTVDFLLEEAIVDRAAIYCDDLELEREAQSLRDYLFRRRDGGWTSFDDATRLAVIVEEANAYWRQIETDRKAPVEETRAPPPVKPEGLLATMRNLLLRGGSRGRT